MKNIKKIAIIGVGFMGGSLALAIREKYPDISVWGYARCRKSYNKLSKLKILDKVSENLEECLKKAEMVVLALPVDLISDYLKKISPFLNKNTIVFDLGSSKKIIEKKAVRYLPKNIDFVGCHPLAGSEKSGAQEACKDLYKGAVCVITSSPAKLSVKVVKNLWEKLGSKVTFINPDNHDKALSCVSHLPHIISFALTGYIPMKYIKFTSGSFKDLTRISGSPAEIWTDIFLSNKKNILKDLKGFSKVLKEFEFLLKKGDRKKLFTLIKKINTRKKTI